MGWINTPWSIRRVVRQDIADWTAFNACRKRYALSWLDKELLFAGERPWRFCVSLFLLMLALWVLGQLIPENWVVPRWENWGAEEQLAHFTALWSVQATLAALVYPIVIAFVTVFLQRRPASEAFVHLYILDSGALVAGLSSLALVVLMAAQYVMLSTHGAPALPGWVALDAAWFLLNAVLTTFFLYRTIDFLRPEVQLAVVRRYALNVALPREIARLYSFQVLSQAQSKKWIPAPVYLDDKVPDGPKVMLYGIGFREGAEQGQLVFHEPSRLHNVRLWPLRLVVDMWMRSARKWPRSTKSGLFESNKWPLLTFSFVPGRVYADTIPLANVDAGPSLEKWQQLLLRWAFVFKATKGERSGIQLAALLSELETDAREAASKHDAESFQRAYDTFVTLHELLLEASLVKQEDGTTGSWALLPNSQSIFEQRLHVEWADSYRSIFLAAIEAITHETRPAKRVCHIAQHLNGKALEASPIEVREQVLQLSGLFMFQLGSWWARRIEEQGIMDHGSHQSAVLRPPLHRTYDEVLQSFVSGWESARGVIANLPDPQNFDWTTASAIVQLQASHIEKTARMLLGAVSRGDKAAAEWLVDILTKWWGTHDHYRQPFSLYNKTDFLTIEHIALPWEKVYSTLGLNDQDTRWDDRNLLAVQRGVVVAALRNYWTDIRLITVELLLWWARNDERPNLDESLAVDIASGLLIGKLWKGGGTMSDPLSNLSAPGYLLAKVRQYAASGEYRGGYVSRLSGFVESIKDMQRPSMVSARIYSFSGADDVGSLQDLQLTLLAVLSDSDWTPSNSLRQRIDVWLGQQYDSVAVLKNRLEEFERRVDEDGAIPTKLYSTILRRTAKVHDAATGWLRAKQGIQALKGYLEEKRAEALANEPVDPDRLKQLAIYASRTGFQAATAEFPVPLFSSVKFRVGDLNDFKLRSQQVRKGELTKIEIDQRASNEDDFWAETMANQVGAIVLSDVIRALAVREIHTPDAASYWGALKTEAARLTSNGQHPLLILDNATRPDWVWDWQHADYGEKRYPKPDDLNVRQLEGQGDGYVCHLNEIRVFSGALPPGQSILLPQEAFQLLEFKAYEEGRFVDATVVQRADSKLLVDLVMTISRRVRIGAHEAIRLRYDPKQSHDDKENNSSD
ncbi:hypothetical protein [Polaromonas aquatica]|uniref:hypothetical protein n=1 Tax=Polaromonas aquatica TaxID=332657 RepID=UPI003D64BC43